MPLNSSVRHLRTALDFLFEMSGGAKAFFELNRAWRTGSAPAVMPLLYVEIMRACNLSCVYCGFPHHYPADGKIMKRAELAAVFAEAKKLETRIVSFGGGEPFLRRDLFDVIGDAMAAGLRVHLDSNATLIDADKAARLADFPGLSMLLSLDHPDPVSNDILRGSGVFAAVETAVSRIRRLAPAVSLGLNCVISRPNLGRLVDMLELGARWGVDTVRFTPLHTNLNHRYRNGTVAEDYGLRPGDLASLGEELERLLERSSRLGVRTNSPSFLRLVPDVLSGRTRIPCFAGYMYGNIDPYGHFFPCYDYTAGLNVRQQGLIAVWRSEGMQRLRERVRHCNTICWNTGNAEPSIRMNLGCMLRHPLQVFRDYGFYLK